MMESLGEKISTCRYKTPGWSQIKVGMDPVEKCSCNLDRAHSH